MKQFLSVLLAGIILLSLCACTPKQETFISPLNLYFLKIQPVDHIHHGSVDSVIGPLQIEGNMIRKNPTLVLEAYFSTPDTESFRSPFPDHTQLIKWEENGTMLCITLSDELAQMTGIELSLACACLTRTCLELWQYDAVQIRAETQLLDGRPSITMNAENLLLIDDTFDDPESMDE